VDRRGRGGRRPAAPGHRPRPDQRAGGAAEPDCPNVALSYVPENKAARALYASLGFVETGELEDDEIVARWTKR
jgi:RimJ/RimL family protein N-acetyltransferase